MTLSGSRLIRQVFGELLPPGYTVAQGYMEYKHEHDVEWQVLTFHVNTPDGNVIKVTSDRVPARDDVNELTRRTVSKFVEGLKNAQTAPTGTPSADAPANGTAEPKPDND
jgi:hypothetical protein